jgi:hypothetical protein
VQCNILRCQALSSGKQNPCFEHHQTAQQHKSDFHHGRFLCNDITTNSRPNALNSFQYLFALQLSHISGMSLRPARTVEGATPRKRPNTPFEREDGKRPKVEATIEEAGCAQDVAGLQPIRIALPTPSTDPKDAVLSKKSTPLARSPPADWETIYASISKYRESNPAAVDRLGCERLADVDAPDKACSNWQ